MTKKTCKTCGTPLGNRNITGQCEPCRSVCHCGTPKDPRAAECQSCAMSRKAKAQWANDRDTILAGIHRAAPKRRLRFEDLTEDSNWQRRHDGRMYIDCWLPNGKRGTVYRYQWRWIKAHGPIPRGHVIHHKDDDRTNDDLSNLELMTRAAHNRHHLTQARLTAMVEATGRKRKTKAD